VNDWQPIETAPKDGSIIMLYGEYMNTYNCAGKVFSFGYYFFSQKQWMCYPSHNEATDHIEPTHWQPLPEPPEDV
jgi:hypothetical protein